MLSDLGLAALVPDVGADLVCEGHTRWPVDRTVAGVRVVNARSVSNPAAMGLRASYALVEATTAGYQVEHRRVAYDLEVVIAAIEGAIVRQASTSGATSAASAARGGSAAKMVVSFTTIQARLSQVRLLNCRQG